jgi:2-keto-4-pentenoate hydratase/2-oxohepta-3-ene-1,7-dioic acid hydratase in catechol pathway
MHIATLRQKDGDQTILAFVQDDQFYSVPEIATDLDVVSSLIDPLSTTWLSADGLTLLRDLEKRRNPGIGAVDLDHWSVTTPVLKPGKIVAVGRNYMDHVREGQEIWAKRGKKVEIPTFPSAFAKFPSSLTGPYDPVSIPDGLNDIDYEIELAVVIGKPALCVSEAQALSYVAGYCICNDLAARGIQRREMEQQIGITLAKNFPGFAPMGPWLTTADQIPDPQALELRLDVDGDIRQHANTYDMIFPVAKLIAYFSQMGLETGDILITGTPSGVALARPEPEPYYLKSGQVVTAWIEGLGEIKTEMR